MQLIPVPLSESEVGLYYEGFSNATLWPLYHDVVAPPAYSRLTWESYRAVNDRFARAAAEEAIRAGDGRVRLRTALRLTRRSGVGGGAAWPHRAEPSTR